MKVTVTTEDIKKAREPLGGMGYERCCPVARALFRMGYVADVCTHHIKFGSTEVAMPQKAIDWISRYDKKERANPFSFELPFCAEQY